MPCPLFRRAELANAARCCDVFRRSPQREMQTSGHWGSTKSRGANRPALLAQVFYKKKWRYQSHGRCKKPHARVHVQCLFSLPRPAGRDLRDGMMPPPVCTIRLPSELPCPIDHDVTCERWGGGVRYVSSPDKLR